jgi:hypothetical protein
LLCYFCLISFSWYINIQMGQSPEGGVEFRREAVPCFARKNI